MTLVILAATPVLAMVGIAIGIVMAGLGKKASAAYAKASSIVAENLGNVRTVLAFNGAEHAVKAYERVRIQCSYPSQNTALKNSESTVHAHRAWLVRAVEIACIV